LFHDLISSSDNSHEKEVVFVIKNQLPAGVTLDDKSLEELVSQAPIGSIRVESRPHFSSFSKSTSLGLNHIALACKGARGSFSIQAAEGTKGHNTAALSTIVLPAFIESTSQNINLEQTPAIYVAKKVKSMKNMEQNFPGGLKICAIDDSSMICKGYERLCLPALKADIASSRVVCPRSKADVDDFLAFVIGKDGSADIIILDQNIELCKEEGIIFGTALASKLRGLGFLGLIAIRSANSSPDDKMRYLKAGADLCIGKDQSNKVLASIISCAYVEKKNGWL